MKADADGYTRILNNLIQNVISHSHGDKIEIALSEQEGKIKILVSDNGVGMDKEDLKHIFERLYKCDKGRTERNLRSHDFWHVFLGNLGKRCKDSERGIRWQEILQ